MSGEWAMNRPYRRAFATLAVLGMLSVSGGSLAQAVIDAATVRTAVQAAVDRTDAQASALSLIDATGAYTTAMQGAIAASGAQPSVVEAALAEVSCKALAYTEAAACKAALQSIDQQVMKLAAADVQNTRIAAIRRAEAAFAAFGGAPVTSNGASGGGTSYVH